MSKDKKQYPHPDNLHGEILKQAEEQEEIEAQIAELKSAKSALEKLNQPVPEELVAKIAELESSKSQELVPSWTKNHEWIEHLENKKRALEEAIKALSSTSGVEIVKIAESLREKLAKIDKVLSAPKDELHGFSHADYARKVDAVMTSIDVASEGSDEKVQAQIAELHKDLENYEAAFEEGNITFLSNQQTVLTERKKRLEKALEKNDEQPGEDEGSSDNIKKLIAQIELNLQDLRNKNSVNGRAARQWRPLLVPSVKDSYQEYKRLWERQQHIDIMIRSGVKSDEDPLREIQGLIVQTQAALEKVKEELKQLIIARVQDPKSSTTKEYWKGVLQQTFLDKFQDWTMEVIEKIEQEVRDNQQPEVDMSPEELADLELDHTGTLEEALRYYYYKGEISMANELINTKIKQHQRVISNFEQHLDKFEADLEKLKQLKVDASKGLMGDRTKKRELLAFQREIYEKYEHNKFCVKMYESAGEKVREKRRKGKLDNKAILMSGMAEFIRFTDVHDKKITSLQKFIRCLSAKDVDKQLERLKFLKDKLEAGEKS